VSRLYGVMSSDAVRNIATQRGNKGQTVSVCYGSRLASNLAVQVHVCYLKGDSVPRVWVTVGKGIEYELCCDGETLARSDNFFSQLRTV